MVKSNSKRWRDKGHGLFLLSFEMASSGHTSVRSLPVAAKMAVHQNGRSYLIAKAGR